MSLGGIDGLTAAASQHETATVVEIPVEILIIPKAWVLVMPCGCVDGILVGSERHPTAEAAWSTFTPLKRNRDREAAKGWTVRPATADEIAHPTPNPSDHEGHAL